MIRAEGVVLTFLTIVFEHAAPGNATFVAFFNSFFPNNSSWYGEIIPITIITSTLALFHNYNLHTFLHELLMQDFFGLNLHNHRNDF